MKIFYIKYREDNVSEDGIWLFANGELGGDQFFVSLDDALSECDHRNAIRRNLWLASVEKTKADWESKERAWKALEGVEGFDPRKLFPYHKRVWTQVEPEPTFIVETLEVKNASIEVSYFGRECGCKSGCKARQCDK